MKLKVPEAISLLAWLRVFEHRGENYLRVDATPPPPFGELGLKGGKIVTSFTYSPFLSQISLKNSFGKVVFQISVKIKMMRNKNRLFGRHFETVNILFFFFFFQNYDFL